MNATPLTASSPSPTSLSAIDQEGKSVALSDLFKSGWTLVYFYPKADTPGCTKQACAIRDDFSGLQSKGLRVFGVSTDSPASQKQFQEKYQLPFPLLADEDQKIAKAFGVPATGGFAQRMSFLIKDGQVVWTQPKVNVSSHLDEVKKAMGVE